MQNSDNEDLADGAKRRKETGTISLKDYIRERGAQSRKPSTMSSKQGHELITLTRLQQKRSRDYSDHQLELFENDKVKKVKED